MFDSTDENWKIFTDVVTKNTVDVLIQTTTHLIKGKAHVRTDHRLVDEINQDSMFLAVTDAVILDSQEEEIHSASFLAINRHQIVWILPNETEGKLAKGAQ